jgi:hypothetical protein
MESEGIVEACSIPRGETERRDGVFNIIDAIVSRSNLNCAYKRVKANKGSAGVGGMEVDKDDGSKRKLGIPTVIDRFVQQAILQVIEGIIDPTFSESSFGFRPKRSAHDAMRGFSN